MEKTSERSEGITCHILNPSISRHESHENLTETSGFMSQDVKDPQMKHELEAMFVNRKGGE